MGLFDKKYCDFCGGKIGLLGNRKLEDGNMCKECASRLSPWFSERRHSTKEDIALQLAYREENRAAVRDFRVTRSLGRHTKLLLDEDAGKFMVTSATDLNAANPDVLDFAQITGCDLDVHESSYEIYRRVGDKDVSYSPPRYNYSYDFDFIINVNHPYFDEIKFRLNNFSIDTGELPGGTPEYNSYINLSEEIKTALMNARQTVRDGVAAQNAPKIAVTCKLCGATTIPDDHGRCEYCGGTAI